jgi:hypothetical protein
MDLIVRWSGRVTKRLCKLNRREIAENLGQIYSLVSESKFLCRSCARSSHDSDSLCKPAAIPPQSCLLKSDAEKKECTILAGTVVSKDKPMAVSLIVSKKEIKKVKKRAKLQKKYIKKLEKVAKMQAKLAKKQKKVEKQLLKIPSFFEEPGSKPLNALH